jgi:formate--tetrahydrofolate ligase
MSDYLRSKSVSPKSIGAVAGELGLHSDEVLPYGRAKAKIALSALARLADRPLGRYVLVTAINPTPLGEGKTTTAIGLAMALCRLGHRAIVTLRQPSLGPVFGIKGGGTGGGRAQVIPMEEINLHLTGDAHAVASAHDLLSAFVDNSLFHGNPHKIDPAHISWPRVLGLSDRALREVQIVLPDGPRKAQFVITEASEVMAIIALSSDLRDLRRRVGGIVIGMTREGRLVTAEDLKCAGAMAVLLKDALCPNLLQTMEGTPAVIHAGPFGNIAHGNSSIIGDALALRCADYVVTEAGFGSELGAEKFCHIKCRASGLQPSAAVVVATLRALKLHGGGGTEALRKGLGNLAQHIDNMRTFGLPVVVAVNAFAEDPADELEQVRRWALAHGAAAAAVSTHWADGGAGAEALAEAVVTACRQPAQFTPLYPDTASIKQKIEVVAKRMYGAAAVRYEELAESRIETATRLGFERFPVCMAKTPLSLSHDPKLLGRPSGFTLPVRDLRILAGAEFLTVVCSGIQLMPGLPTRPVGERIDLNPETGEILGM